MLRIENGTCQGPEAETGALRVKQEASWTGVSKEEIASMLGGRRKRDLRAPAYLM